MATIEGIKLDGLEDALGGSPEESAKKFLEIAGVGIGQVVADALDQALNSSLGSENPEEWAKLIGPCFLDVSFTVPEGTTPRQVNSVATPSREELGGGPDVSITIGITIKY